MRWTITVLTALAVSTYVYAAAADESAVTYDSRSFKFNNTRELILSGAVHYARYFV